MLVKTLFYPIYQKIKNYFLHLSKKQKIKWGISLVLLLWFWFSLPATLFNQPTCFVLTDKNGELLNATIAADGQWRFPYNANVPLKFAACITTFEDKRFYYHIGLDPMAMARAIKLNIKGNKIVSGGSTLTMQVMRLHYGNNSRSIFNKLKETILAIRLECSYKKKTILALYTNNAPFGTNVVGLDAAAWRYYGRQANTLTWGEMAALAVLPNAPALVHPGRNKNELLRKRNVLLDKLLERKIIDSTTCQLSKYEPLPAEPKALPLLAPHLLWQFKKTFKPQENSTTLLQTSIDIQLQKHVTQLVQTHVQGLAGNQIKNGAAMVLENETGKVLAYVGNVFLPKDSSVESFVDVLQSARSPGSTLKPLLYASMLSEGQLMPKQIVPDIPTQFGGYTPQNFDLGYDGAVPANRALSRSLNIPAVKMLQQFKYPKFYSYLKNFGFTTLNKPADFYGMSLILGGCEVTPFQLAGVYSNMARMYIHEAKNKGKWNNKDWFMPNYNLVDNQSLPNFKTANTSLQLLNYPSIWHTLNAMNEVMRPGEEGLWGMFNSAQRIAWKTGTSFGFRDGWSIGITAKYCVVVWIGNTTGEGSASLTGIQAAAPLMFQIFRNLPSSNWFAPPTTGFNYITTCKNSGYKASKDCAETETILVSEEAKNASNCPYCRTIHVNQTEAFRVNETCLSPSNMVHKGWFVLPPTMEFYYKQSHPNYKTLPPFMSGCGVDGLKVLDFIYPDDNAVVYIPIELNGNQGTVVFKAAHKVPNTTLFWHLDENFVGSTQRFHQLELNPTIGKHTITIVDELGNSSQRSFEVTKKE